jgi:hypothetical protein
MNAGRCCHRKALNFAAALALAALFIGGCGKEPAPTPPPAEPTSATPPAEPAPAPPEPSADDAASDDPRAEPAPEFPSADEPASDHSPAQPYPAESYPDDSPAESAPATPLPEPAPATPPAGSLAGSVSAVDRIIQAMDWGNVAYNVPRSIRLGATEEIQLLLSLQQSLKDLQHDVTAAGEVEGARVQVSNVMKASLSGSDFQIEVISPETQAISSTGTTEWKWEIRPKTAGEHQVHLVLSALFEVDGVSAARPIKTYDRTITIEVTPGYQVRDFIRRNWQWLWAAVLVPLVTVYVKWKQGDKGQGKKKKPRIKKARAS